MCVCTQADDYDPYAADDGSTSSAAARSSPATAATAAGRDTLGASLGASIRSGGRDRYANAADAAGGGGTRPGSSSSAFDPYGASARTGPAAAKAATGAPGRGKAPAPASLSSTATGGGAAGAAGGGVEMSTEGEEYTIDYEDDFTADGEMDYGLAAGGDDDF